MKSRLVFVRIFPVTGSDVSRFVPRLWGLFCNHKTFIPSNLLQPPETTQSFTNSQITMASMATIRAQSTLTPVTATFAAATPSSSAASSSSHGGLSTGDIVGIAIGCTAALLAISTCLFLCCCNVRLRRSGKRSKSQHRVVAWMSDPSPGLSLDTSENNEKPSSYVPSLPRLVVPAGEEPQHGLFLPAGEQSSERASESSVSSRSDSVSESSSGISTTFETHKRQAVDELMAEASLILRQNPLIGISIRAGGRDSSSDSNTLDGTGSDGVGNFANPSSPSWVIPRFAGRF